jgi:hypothetical protein
MPYVSKIDQERAQWMTLREALARIEKADHCSLRAAWAQFGEASADGELDVRWADAIRLTQRDWDDEDIGPPTNIRFWRSARRIFIRGGVILDDPVSRKSSVRLQLIRQNKLLYRGVLIRRDDVERLWPTANGTAGPQLPTASLSHDTELSPPTSVARRKWPEAEIRKEITRILADRSSSRPDENQIHYIVNEKLPGASRSVVRRLIDESGEGRAKGRPRKS